MARYKKPKEEIVAEPEKKEGYIRDYLTGKWKKATPEEVEARQVFLKRLVEEYEYSQDQIETEYEIQKGSKRIGPADIVIFRNDKKTFDNIYLIIECKRKDRKDGLNQLKSYLNPTTAEGGAWFNGKDIAYLRMLRNPTRFPEWRNIPRKGQKWEEIGKHRKASELKPSADLKSVFNVIYYHLYTNSNLPRAERLGAEMTRLIFCKIYDELHNSNDLKFKAGADESDKDVAERIKKIYDYVKKEYDDVFFSDEKIILDDKSIAYVINQLQELSLLGTDKDAVGDAFEVFIGPGLRGEKGQFFTPRNVVRMSVQMLNPKPGEKIIDPACGSGGFLIISLEHIWKKIEEEYSHLSKERIGSKKAEVASRYIFGIDKEFDLAKSTKAYMAIIGDGRGGVFNADTLDTSDWKPAMKEKVKDGTFDVVLTNPPFGSKIPITSEKILQQYELGFKWKKDKEGKWRRTNKVADKQAPQILFVERCLSLLKERGRMGIVLPDGILGNINDGYIREFILQNAIILAVIDCPPETFMPSTSTKTSVLFLEKRKKGFDYKNHKTFMAIVENCGHNRRGQPLFKTDGKLNDDFPEVSKAYNPLRSKR